MCLSVPFALSWLIIIFARNVTALYIARIFAGCAIGGICVTAPLYIGEIAENSIRGTLGSYFQVCQNQFYLLYFTLNYSTFQVIPVNLIKQIETSEKACA